jgi:hypothetical protein
MISVMPRKRFFETSPSRFLDHSTDHNAFQIRARAQEIVILCGSPRVRPGTGNDPDKKQMSPLAGSKRARAGGPQGTAKTDDALGSA